MIFREQHWIEKILNEHFGLHHLHAVTHILLRTALILAIYNWWESLESTLSPTIWYSLYSDVSLFHWNRCYFTAQSEILRLYSRWFGSIQILRKSSRLYFVVMFRTVFSGTLWPYIALQFHISIICFSAQVCANPCNVLWWKPACAWYM